MPRGKDEAQISMLFSIAQNRIKSPLNRPTVKAVSLFSKQSPGSNNLTLI